MVRRALLALALCTSPALAQQTLYASADAPASGRDCLSVAQACRTNDALALLDGTDTLRVLPEGGVYKGADNMLIVPTDCTGCVIECYGGTAADCVFDGENARQPCSVQNRSSITVRHVACVRSSAGVSPFRLGGDAGQVIEYVIAGDCADDGLPAFLEAGESDDATIGPIVRHSAGIGYGCRKMFGATDDACWEYKHGPGNLALFEGTTAQGPKGGVTMHYDCDDRTWTSSVAIWTNALIPQANHVKTDNVGGLGAYACVDNDCPNRVCTNTQGASGGCFHDRINDTGPADDVAGALIIGSWCVVDGTCFNTAGAVEYDDALNGKDFKLENTVVGILVNVAQPPLNLAAYDDSVGGDDLLILQDISSVTAGSATNVIDVDWTETDHDFGGTSQSAPGWGLDDSIYELTGAAICTEYDHLGAATSRALYPFPIAPIVRDFMGRTSDAAYFSSGSHSHLKAGVPSHCFINDTTNCPTITYPTNDCCPAQAVTETHPVFDLEAWRVTKFGKEPRRCNRREKVM